MGQMGHCKTRGLYFFSIEKETEILLGHFNAKLGREDAFQLSLRVCHYEGSGKPGWLEVKWYTSACGFW